MHQKTTSRKTKPPTKADDDALLMQSLRMALDTDVGRCRFSNAVLMVGLQDDALRLAIYRVMPYGAYLQTDCWRKRSATAKQRAGGRCQLCNSQERLETHHKTYARRGCESDTDLIVLCHRCHDKHHADMPEDDGSGAIQTTDQQELALLLKEIERRRVELGIDPNP